MVNASQITLYIIIGLGVLAAIFLIRALWFILKVLRNYVKLGHEEFMKKAREGVLRVTPLQQTKSQFWAHPFIIVGILTGIVLTILNDTLWLSAILFGSLILEGWALFALYQLYLNLKKQDELMKQLEIQSNIIEKEVIS